jgi:prophage regulatory protein
MDTQAASHSAERILPFEEVRLVTGLSRSTIRRLERTGRFPRRRQVSANRVGWLRSEVDAFIEAIKSGGQR